ncbi:DNA sulfur modification protein DndB [Brevibacillus laterosporus]|uniref:DNA sulfur modification protein DndB n=1 Tax=Brevibacillus laterosporus TaxID=1465 RepID=UPI000B9C3881|nr:DNA sulfur modification protein DndB [Brevibacillus laterosporus]MED1789062.1 DNA sulfur modification protein DndB [Brevibacillus laterosporus]
MQIGVTREMVEEVLSQAIAEIKTSKKNVYSFKKLLSLHGIGLADSQRIINGKTPLNQVENSILCLFLIYIKAFIKEDSELKIKVEAQNYFTSNEINEVKLMEIVSESIENESLLPYTFTEAKQFELDDYDTFITEKQIYELVEGNIIQYNFDTQREAKIIRTSSSPTGIIKVPKLNEEAVKEITKLILAGKLVRTNITLNARLNSSDSGQELLFNQKDKTLTVTEGTKLDCLDGFHRLTALVNALKVNPDIKMTFGLRIVNYSTKKAQILFSQINTFTSQSASRLAEMRQSFSSYVVKQLREESVIGDKISSSDSLSFDQLVTFNVLDSAIDENFHPTNIIEAKNVVDILKETFDSIAMKYPNEFIVEVDNSKKETVVNQNQMFNVYVMLAKKLNDLDLPLSDITKVLSKFDFSRSNPLWQDAGILDQNKNITPKSKRKILNLFKKLNIEEEIKNV